jgi:hypothetical protein
MTLGEAVKAMRAVSARSILSLPPVLQKVWTAAYAAVVQGEHSVLANPETVSMPSDATIGTRSETAAWEAVRRANGGEIPGEPRRVDDKTWKRSAIREALLWFADEGHYEGTYRQGAGFVDAVGLTKAREALGIPIERDDRSLMPLAEALTHSVTIGADVDEPTDEEMVEALAPIVATSRHGEAWNRLDAYVQAAHINDIAAQLRTGDSTIARVAIASWKAARAWGRK